jgi:hypothetical protein
VPTIANIESNRRRKEMVSSGASGRSIGKSNDDAICIDDDENSSDEACYI